MMTDVEIIRIGEEVRASLDAGAAVVALESTLIAQGLPWPTNLETAKAAESAVRRAGATPATMAVIGGTPRIGLTERELEVIAESGRFRKAGRRDLSAAVALGRDAAVTVSATVFLARRVGIGVVATGGLGGVHRGWAERPDISTDLDELARADGMLVVCSGAKSLLDLPATLEVLETLGVPVVGYRTDELPGFTTIASGLPLEASAQTPEQAAALVRAHRALGLPGAVVLAQPAPAEDALDAGSSRTALQSALVEAKARGIVGKELTPFLLERVRIATGGEALRANRSLILANAALAGTVARSLARENR